MKCVVVSDENHRLVPRVAIRAPLIFELMESTYDGRPLEQRQPELAWISPHGGVGISGGISAGRRHVPSPVQRLLIIDVLADS